MSHSRTPDPPAPDADEVIRLDFEVDAVLTLAELGRGPRDPTIRFEGPVVWRASRTRDGAATLRIAPARDGRRVTAWGPGARAALEALPRLLGADDDPSALVLPPGRLRDLARRLAGMRFGRSNEVWPSLLPAICGQKVTAAQAHRAYFGIVRRWGEPAPGAVGLWLAPQPEVVASLPYYELHAVGLEQRRAVTLIRAAREADRLQGATELPPEAARQHLMSVPGIGPWSAAEVARVAFGDADAVSLGDYHLPNLVCWALAAEPRGDDARMLELLEPYRGQRARVVRLLERSGIHAPRYGPRLRPQRIERL